MVKQYSQHLCTTELLCLTPLIMLQCLRTIIRPKIFTRIHHLPESCTFNATWWFVPNFRKCWVTVFYVALFNLEACTRNQWLRSFHNTVCSNHRGTGRTVLHLFQFGSHACATSSTPDLTRWILTGRRGPVSARKCDIFSPRKCHAGCLALVFRLVDVNVSNSLIGLNSDWLQESRFLIG